MNEFSDKQCGSRSAGNTIKTAKDLESVHAGSELTAALLNTPFDAVCVIDARLRVLDFNEAFERTSIQLKSGIVGTAIRDVLPPETSASLETSLKMVFATGEPVRYEAQWYGSWYDSIIYPVHDAERRVSCAAVVSHDITLRRQAEEDLRRSKKMLDQAQRIAMLGSWNIDLTTGAIYWSDELYRMLGYAPGEIVPSYDAICRHIHPEDAEQFLMRNSKEQANDSYSQMGTLTEVRIIARDGTVKWVLGNVEADCDEAGAPCRICGTVQDITESRKMKEALRESREKFQGLFLASGEGILLCDSRWRIIGMNRALEGIIGRVEKEYLGMSACDMIVEFFPDDQKTPELYEFLNDRLATFLADRDSVTGEFEISKKIGQVQTLAYNIFRIPIGPDCLYGGIMRDITEMRRAEEQSQRLGRIIEESLNEIYILDAQTLRFLMANRGARENLNYSMQELSALTPFEINAELSKAQIEAAFEPLRSGALKVQQLETLHRRKDGSVYPVEICLHRGCYDNAEVFVAHVLDITRRKLGEDALRRSEERFRAIFNNAGIGIGLVDKDGRYAQVNSCWAGMLGYTVEELLHLKHLDIMHPDDREKVQEKLGQLDSGSMESYYGERRFIRKDGGVFWVSGAATPLPDGRGGFEAIIGLAADVTDRKKAEHEREELIVELKKALAQIRTLRGLLPICSSCKKMRDDRGYWNTLESYIVEHSEAEFTHGLCPDCLKKYFPDVAEDLQ